MSQINQNIQDSNFLLTIKIVAIILITVVIESITGNTSFDAFNMKYTINDAIIPIQTVNNRFLFDNFSILLSFFHRLIYQIIPNHIYNKSNPISQYSFAKYENITKNIICSI